MMKAVKYLKNKKASGSDCISNEMIKASYSVLPNLYVDIFNTILRSGVFLSLWRENFIKPLFKGGDMNNPSCYRGIAISSCLTKLFTRIMFNKLDEYLENNNIICPERKGFRKGMRTSDHSYTLKTLIVQYFKKNKYVFACFIDLKKAFDTVNRNALLHKIFQYNIRGNFFSVLESMYKRKYHFLLICQINTFETNIGVKQCCILIPTLFYLYINDLIDHFGPECEPLELNRKPISCLLYADDIILLSESAKGLQKSLDLLKTYCDKGSTIYLEGGGRGYGFFFRSDIFFGQPKS